MTSLYEWKGAYFLSILRFFVHGNYYALGLDNLAKIDLLSMSLEYKYAMFFATSHFMQKLIANIGLLELAHYLVVSACGI